MSPVARTICALSTSRLHLLPPPPPSLYSSICWSPCCSLNTQGSFSYWDLTPDVPSVWTFVSQVYTRSWLKHHSSQSLYLIAPYASTSSTLSLPSPCMAFLLCSDHYAKKSCIYFLCVLSSLLEWKVYPNSKVICYCLILSACHTTAEILHPCFTG